MDRQFFLQDKTSVGIIVGIGAMAVTALLLTAGLLVVGEPIMAHLRWYGGIFIPLVFIIRYYVKQQLSLVTKTLFIIFFLFFIAFMILLFGCKVYCLWFTV